MPLIPSCKNGEYKACNGGHLQYSIAFKKNKKKLKKEKKKKQEENFKKKWKLLNKLMEFKKKNAQNKNNAIANDTSMTFSLHILHDQGT